MKKTIDVIIPAYNAEKFIEKTIRSVLEQTYLPEKIIVVNDGSIDKTVEVVEEISKTSKVPIILISQENRGPNAARNVGLEHSDSEYIALLDADDIWKEEKLEKQLQVFEKSELENLGLVYTAYDLIDENGCKIKQSFLVFKLDPDLRGYVFNKMFDAMKITGSCSGVLIKKKCFEKVGFFDESLRGAEDWDMWIRISKEFQIDYVNETLVHVRVHDKNSHNDQVMMAENMIMFLKKWSGILDVGHPGRTQLARKSFDYFFKAVFMFKFVTACKLFKLYSVVLLREERSRIFNRTKGSVFLFALFCLPHYCIKQVRRVASCEICGKVER